MPLYLIRIVSIYLGIVYTGATAEDGNMRGGSEKVPCDMSPEGLNIDTWNSPLTPTYILANAELERLTTEIRKLGSDERPVFKISKILSK